MSINRFATLLVAGFIAAPAASFASTIVEITYDFSGEYYCGAPGLPDLGDSTIGACQSDASVAYVPQADVTFDPTIPVISAPTLTVLGGTFTQSAQDEFVSQFRGGLSVGNEQTTGAANIGSDETLFLTFSEAVTVVEFEVTAFRPGQEGKLANGGELPFDFGVGVTTVDTTEELISGETFRWTTATLDEDVDGGLAGYFLRTVTIALEVHDETPVIPVPPALPLLGGALGLLFWRARKGKKAA